METTEHLGLKLINSAEWQTTYFKDYINAMAANDGTSNMAKIDAAVAALQEAVTDIPPPITGSSEQVTAGEAISKGNVVRIEDTNAYLATTATTASSYQLGIAESDIASGAVGTVTVIAYVDSHADSIIEQNHGGEQKIWRGTKSEYDAVTEKRIDTLYLVTDDDGTSDAVVTGAELEDRLAQLTAADITFDASETTMTAANVQSAITELFQNVDDGKALVASAITDKGIETSEDAAFQQLADNITKIETGTDTSDATIAAADIRSGKIGYGADGRVVGTVADVEAATPGITCDANGLITASVNQSSGFVTAATKTATKQLSTLGATTYTPGTTQQAINAQVYLTGAQTIQGDANLVSSNIKSGVSIFGVAGSLEADTKQTATVTVRCYTTSTMYLMYQKADGDFGAAYMEDGDRTTLTTYVGAWLFGFIDGGSSMAYNTTGMTKVGPGDTSVVQVRATSATVYYGDA